MARGAAQKEYRAACARVGLEIPKEEKAQWDAYAASLGIPTGRMIRRAVERDMIAAGWKAEEISEPVKAPKPAAVASPAQPEAKPASKPVSAAAPKSPVRRAWSGISSMEED